MTANKKREEEEKKKLEEQGLTPEEAKAALARRPPGEIRIKKDLNDLDLPPHIAFKQPEPANFMLYRIIVDLSGESSECFWRGGKYQFTITIPNDYPHTAPKCHCDTQIYHPNIDMLGNVCLNILRADWKPVLNLNAVIVGLYFLFLQPNPDDPLNHEAASLMRQGMHLFKDKVQKTMRGGNHDGATFTKFI